VSTCNPMKVRSSYHHGDLQAELVRAAREVLAASGPDAFSLREVARVVGVTPNATYRHFPDKAGLLTALAVEGFRELAARMTRPVGTSSLDLRELAVKRFVRVGEAYVAFALEHPALFRVMFGPSGMRCMEGASRSDPTPYAVLGASLDELVAAGAMAAQERPGAELKAWSVVHGFACLILDGAISYPSRAAQRGALESVLLFAASALTRKS
jgi:AcrR family transcriptional regulator